MSTIEEIQLYKLIVSKCNSKLNEKAYINLEWKDKYKTGSNWGEFCDIFVSTDEYNIAIEMKKITVQKLRNYNQARRRAVKQTINDFKGTLVGNIRQKKTKEEISIDKSKQFIGITVLLPCDIHDGKVIMSDKYISVGSKTLPDCEQFKEYRVYDIMFSGLIATLSRLDSITNLVKHLIYVNNNYGYICIDSVIASLNDANDTVVKVIFIDKYETTLVIDSKSIKENSQNTGIFEVSRSLTEKSVNKLKYPLSNTAIQNMLINSVVRDTVNIFKYTHDINRYIIYCVYNTLIFEVKICSTDSPLCSRSKLIDIHQHIN